MNIYNLQFQVWGFLGSRNWRIKEERFVKLKKSTAVETLLKLYAKVTSLNGIWNDLVIKKKLQDVILWRVIHRLLHVRNKSLILWMLQFRMDWSKLLHDSIPHNHTKCNDYRVPTGHFFRTKIFLLAFCNVFNRYLQRFFFNRLGNL